MKTLANPKLNVWIAVALAVVTMAVYCPVTGFQFINFDDPQFVTENPHVRVGLTAGSFRWVWGSEVANNWHPITMLSLMLGCHLSGIKPWWPHLVNVLLHTANTVLLFGLFKRMTGAVWRSAIVAALFALHPLHVESVAWVSERKDVLSTLFWFLAIWAYVRYTENRKLFYGLSLLFFALGLMSKPMLVTLPFTLLLLDYWPLGRMKAAAGAWQLAAEKIPFFAMSAALCVVTIQAQKQSGAMPLLRDVPMGERVCNALVAYVRYIEMMFWPRHLAGLYPIRADQWPWWGAALAALLLLAVSVVVLTQRRRPYLAAGWLWYVGTLVPVIGLVQVGNQAMADRYTYIPLIGVFVMLVWGSWDLADAWRLGRFAAAATAGALAACAALTMHQESYWKDSETFYKRIIDITSNNSVAHNNLGAYYMAAKRTNEAIINLMAAVQEDPDYAEAHNNLGTALGMNGQIEEAIRHFQKAIRLQPDFAGACYNLGITLDGIGQIDEAISQYREAVRLKPDYAEAHYDLGLDLGRKQQTDEAIRHFREAIRLKPDYAEAQNNLGAALGGKGQIDEAIGHLQEAIRLQPDSAGAHYNLGLALGSKGRIDEAIIHYQEAIRLQPDNARAHNSLGSALRKKGQIDEAIRHYREAIRLQPDFTTARDNLAGALRMKEAPAGR